VRAINPVEKVVVRRKSLVDGPVALPSSVVKHKAKTAASIHAKL
jgi:hypothetical protein